METILFRNSNLLRTRNILNMDPTVGRVYLWILPERISFINIYSKTFYNLFFVYYDAVGLILRKIRWLESFLILGYKFGISSRQACTWIFNSYPTFLEDYFLEIIILPNSDFIRRTLPLSFQKNCSKIQSIIDCFQIEIQKPSDPVQKVLT